MLLQGAAGYGGAIAHAAHNHSLRTRANIHQVDGASARQHVRLVGGFAVDRWNATAKHADIVQRCSDLSVLGGGGGGAGHGTHTTSSGDADTPAGAAVSERLRVLAAAEQDTLTTLHKAVTGRIRRGRDAGHSRL